MSVKLNLLPENLQISKGTTQLLKTSKSLGIVMLVIFIISSLGMAAYFVISQLSFNKLKAEVTNLESQVKAMEGSEQQLILLKDRISKISSINTMPNAVKNLSNLDLILEGVSLDSKMEDVVIAPKKISTSLQLASNSDFTAFIYNLKNSTSFKMVTLTSINYTPESGYKLDTDLDNN